MKAFGKVSMPIAYLLSLTSAVALAETANRYEGPYTSFTTGKKCSQTDKSGSNTDEHVNFAHDYYCDALNTPSAWQKSKDGEIQYDLAIIGKSLM